MKEYFGYKIYEDGRILGLKGRFVQGEISKNGYKRFIFHTPEGKKRWLVHRLIMNLFVGESDLDVNHKNGIKTDNRLENLEYVTRKENIRHSWSSGLAKKRYNSKMHTTKISDELYKRIKESVGSSREVADMFGVSRGSVLRIRKNKQRIYEPS